MPPKRKALAEATNQGTATKPRNAKAAKTSAKSDASKKPAAKATSKSNTKDADKEVDEKTAPVGKRVRTSKTHNVKYSNADTVRLSPYPILLFTKWHQLTNNPTAVQETPMDKPPMAKYRRLSR